MVQPTASSAAATAAPEPTAESEGLDDQAVGGLVDTLAQPDYAAAMDAAVHAAAALTNQAPDEGQVARRERLAPMFTADSSGYRQPGPVVDSSAVAQPTTVNWTKLFNPGDDQRVGVVVSVHFKVSTGATSRKFGEGDAEWRVALTRGPAGWLVAAVSLDASSV